MRPNTRHMLIISLYCKVLLIRVAKMKVGRIPKRVVAKMVKAAAWPGSSYPREDRV